MGPVPPRTKLLTRGSELSLIMSKLDAVLGDVATVRKFGQGSPEMFLQIIRRAAVVRQREAIDALLHMVELDNAAFAVCFLRPAYEEMLWMTYLKSNRKDAADIIMSLSQKILGDSVEAQAAYIGSKNMSGIGISMSRVKQLAAHARTAGTKLRTIGSRLGWRQGAELPSVAFIARKVGREKEYNYIYEATSRYVHFSPQELMRRAWGSPDHLTITTKHFANYWSEFAMHWSLRIFVETLIACDEVLPKESEVAREIYEDLFAALESHIIQVPIVTSEELAWPY